MPFFENTTILCRDPHDFDNYSTMNIKIAFMSNLERPITATTAARQPGLLDRWDLQGGQTAPARSIQIPSKYFRLIFFFSTGYRVHSISLKSFEDQISNYVNSLWLSVTGNICLVFACCALAPSAPSL